MAPLMRLTSSHVMFCVQRSIWRHLKKVCGDNVETFESIGDEIAYHDSIGTIGQPFISLMIWKPEGLIDEQGD